MANNSHQSNGQQMAPHQGFKANNSNGGLMRLQQIKQEVIDTEESDNQEEEEDEEEFDDEDIFPAGGMVPPSRINQLPGEASEEDEGAVVDMKGSQMMHLSTLIGEQADHLIASGNFDVDVSIFESLEIDEEWFLIVNCSPIFVCLVCRFLR